MSMPDPQQIGRTGSRNRMTPSGDEAAIKLWQMPASLSAGCDRMERMTEGLIYLSYSRFIVWYVDSDDFGQSFRAEVGHRFRLMSAGHSD
jgi:hypothetical protein